MLLKTNVYLKDDKRRDTDYLLAVKYKLPEKGAEIKFESHQYGNHVEFTLKGERMFCIDLACEFNVSFKRTYIIRNSKVVGDVAGFLEYMDSVKYVFNNDEVTQELRFHYETVTPYLLVLNKDSLGRAHMLFNDDDAFGVSPRVHNALSKATADTLSEVVRKLIKGGELITLRQFAYYCNQLGLQIDTTNNWLRLDTDAYNKHNEFKYYDYHKNLVLEYDPQTNTNIVFNNDYCVIDASLWIDAFTVVASVKSMFIITYNDKERKEELC